MIKDILIKKPFARITPNGYMQGKIVNDLNNCNLPKDTMFWQIVSYADFLREYYPSGHKINSELFYPNKVKYDEVKKQFFEEKVFRASFPFQMIITTQHLVHLCGNDIHHELTDTKVDEASNNLFLEFIEGWLDKKMEIVFYNFAKSVKIVGDGAIVYYLYNGKLYTKVLSFIDGDTLYPHYDSITGKLTAFARKYTDYDEEGKARVVWVEVWDDKYMYRYRQDKQGFGGAMSKVKEFFGLDGFVLAEPPKYHGFNRCPIVYHRNPDGACWSFVQDSIDKYELAISHLCQNNMAYAFPIMLLKGDDVEIQGDIYGAVKAVTMGKDDDAGFMNRPDASHSFELQLNTLLKHIFAGGFMVMPPEVKSGDLPGVAIKLIYSPSLERAMIDCKEFDNAINDMKELFLYGYGVEKEKMTQYTNLKIFSWAVPYIHQNESELINNLVQACGAGILSKQTGSELTGFDKNNEFDRIMREHKDAQQADLLYQIKTKRQGNETQVEEQIIEE